MAEGGRVDNHGERPVVLSGGCDYIIPNEFARAWAKSLLERLSEKLDKPDDGVLD